MAKENDKPAKELKAQGPELRLLDRRAFVGFPPLELAPGLVISDFALQIPEVTFPFNVSGGASRFQKKRLAFGYLELFVDAEMVARQVAEVAGRLAELEEVKLHFRPGYLEGQGRLRKGERPALTFKAAFDGEGERLAVYLYDVRLYGFSTTPAPHVPVLLSNALADLGLLPDLELRGATGFSSRVLPPLVQRAAVSRGFRVPSLEQARLASAEVSGQGLRLRFSAGGLPPPASFDEELLLALEGARAFADAEGLVARGKLAEAREAYLKLGDAAEAHPFAAERLLALMVADPQAHELALDLAQALARRREKSATALWAEAVVRERRGESARAAERYLALCELSRKNHEEAGAFFAAESATRAARDRAPHMAVKALHELLGLRPDHLPSLKALARASDQAQDRAGAIRAYRRIAALARDPAEAAGAHVRLATLCALTEDDVAGARLHCEAALRLSPDHPDALYQLGELCHRGGEHLRAIKALDRLREVALGRHEVDRIGRANLLAGKIWETGLGQHENALLRYREAVALLPGEAEPLFFAARAAEQVGKLQEALASYQQATELAGPAPRALEVRRAAHQSHHALARLHRTRLGDPARAREHLEAALALEPTDTLAIEELIPYFRASGKSAELADACEKAAAVCADPARRSSYWAEAGELCRGRLGKPERAERLLASALEANPSNRLALEGMLALAESRRDGGQLCACLKGLALLATEPTEKVRLLRRLAVAARDLSFDLELAARALTGVLELEPDDLPTLGELCGLHRRRADMAGLAKALEHRARLAEGQGDRRLAAVALRELAQVLEARLGRVGEALVALEKAARLAPDPVVLLDLAYLSLRCERPLNARRALEDLLAGMPAHAAPERLAEARALLGRACDLLGDRDAAKESYAAAFPLRRLDDELSTRLEALYLESGQEREVTELWAARAQALVSANRSADAAPLFLKSAQVLLAQGETAAASLRLLAALEAAPEGPLAGEVLEAMAVLEQGRGEKLEAAKLWARRAGLLPDALASARLFFKAATLASGSAREEGLLGQALAKHPAFIPARLRRSELLSEKDPKGALQDLEVVLATEPEPAPEGAEDPFSGLPDARERLLLERRAGFAALRAGLLDSARAHLARYAAAHPGDLDVVRELLALYRQSGAKESLCELLGTAWPRLAPEEQPSARREYALLALELERTPAAIDALRQIRACEPTDLWAAKELLELLPVEGDEPHLEAERLDLLTALMAAAEGDERAGLLSRRSRIHHRAHRLDAARADLHDAAAVATQPGALLRELALAWRSAKDEAGEIAAWKMAIGRDPSLAADAATRLLELGGSRLAAHDGQRAREAFEAAAGLPLSPAQRSEAFFGLASAATQLGESAAAADALLEASRHGPGSRRIEALLGRAALLETARDFSAAGVSYEAALALSPGNLEASEGLKRVLAALEDWAALAEVLSSEAARAPKSQQALLFIELGSLYLERLGQSGPAEAAWRRAAALDKTQVEVRQKLVAMRVARGEWVEAAQLAEEAADGLGGARAAMLLREGVALARKAGAAGLAVRLARKAHRLEPAQGEALHELSELIYLRGGRHEALALMRKLAAGVRFEEEPEQDEAALLRLADLEEETGDPEAAQATLRRLLAERPLCGIAVERLAGLLELKSPRPAIELLLAHATSRAPCEAGSALLVSLARRSRDELADLELSAVLLTQAAEISSRALPIRYALAQLFRDSGRTGQLMEELLEIASLEVEAGAPMAAIAAYREEADLAESSGRVDEALKSLQAMAELCEDEGELEQAAHFVRRRAELFRDAKLDLAASACELERSFLLHPEVKTTQLAVALAQRREDHAAEVDWTERTIDLLTSNSERAVAFLQLATLHLGVARAPFGTLGAPPAPDQGEAALRQALVLDPGLAEAEALLMVVLEDAGRAADLAEFIEETALRAQDSQERSRRLLKAAGVYQNAGLLHEAVAALLAARSANPDDLELTARAADLLHQVGRGPEAAEFDALVLAADPFRPAFERHCTHLSELGEWQALAALRLRRAERESGPAAAESYLDAAQAFRRAGAAERAKVCEDQAFEKSPANDEAFEAQRNRYAEDPRGLCAVLLERARAVPSEAPSLLRERAARLSAAGESLAAAEALDELLRLLPDDVKALAARADLADQAGGPAAAAPYDRRLLAAGGESLAPSSRLKSQLRLGHAALEGRAYHDASDAFEAVVQLDPDGERGREALSLLSEVHTRTRNLRGLYTTSLALARGARPDEAEALYRRAAGLFEDPQDTLEALLPLSKLRPSDRAVVDRAAAGLRALGRHPELLELYQRSAEAVGGTLAAQWLLEAAAVAAERLDDRLRARELTRRAGELDPTNPVALRGIAEEQRETKDRARLAATLHRLISATPDADEAALTRLELAGLAAEDGDDSVARPLLEAVAARGPGGAGYPDALEGLEALLTRQGDDACLGKVLSDRAGISSGEERASLLLSAAQAMHRAGEAQAATPLCKAALAARPSVEGLMLLATLHRELGAPARAAEALGQAAQLSPAPAQGPILLEASEAWEAGGDMTSASELLEKVAREHPSLLKPADAAARFERLGQARLAAFYGFAPAMAAGQFERALKLADAAADPEQAREALWALSLKDGASPNAFRLATELREARHFRGMERLGELCERGGAIEHAYSLFEEVALYCSAQPLRQTAVLNLARWGQADRLLEALGSKDPLLESPDELTALLIEAAPGFPPRQRERALELGVERLTEQRPVLLRGLFELRKADRRWDPAVRSLQQLLPLEEDRAERAKLEIELGEILLEPLGRPDEARQAFERALAANAESVLALKRLVALCPEGDPECLVVLHDQLLRLAGPAAVAPHREALLAAYLKLGLDADAHRLLSELPETPERLARRAELAGRLGFTGEALQLRERLTEDPAELEEILQGYLKAELVPFAARLGARLLERGELSAANRRMAAERLAPSAQGASLAIRLWPDLLREQLADADGWTLFAEALRLLDRTAEAEMIDGFGAALTSSRSLAPSQQPGPLSAASEEGLIEPWPGLVEITAESMPRLHHALSEALAGLGAPGRLWLDPQGGTEAYLVQQGLVWGAGALSCFGPAELTFLSALALALGCAGRALTRPGVVEGLAQASAEAFAACRSSLAAARVLAQLDERVRGANPALTEPGALLPANAAFKAVALRALELVERP